MAKHDITQSEARRLFSYCHDSGELTWAPRPRSDFKSIQAFRAWNTKYAHKVAGTIRGDGYVIARINGVNTCLHRVVWTFVNGSPGDMDIDHIDRNPSNNRIGNLRLASRQQNIANSRLRKNNSSNAKGVTRSRGGRWVASIHISGSLRYIGTYDTVTEASDAYMRAARSAFNEFATLGL